MSDFGINSEKINRYFNGKYSDDDVNYVDEVFCKNDNEKELKTLLSRQFNELLPEEDLDNKDLDNILYRIHYDINTRLSRQNMWSFDNIVKWSLRIAGALVLPLIIFVGIHMHNEGNSRKEMWVEIKAPAWTRAQFSLPDGTKGWLNSNSSVKYKGNFTAHRQINLNGEAFFDVFKDKKRPFVVNTNEVNVTVLGTRFNIASYDDEKNVEVVLEEGKLIFKNKEMNKSYTMNPNDLVIYNKVLMDFSTEVVQPHKYLSWTEGRLVFRNDPLDVIARRLARWYNVDVVINGSLADDLRLRATFINENMEEVLGLLKRSLPIDYRIENGVLNVNGIYAKKKVIIMPRIK